MSRDPLFTSAISHQAAGRLDAAEAAYAQLLAAHPADVAALHGWALLAAQRKDFPAALERIDRAIALTPGDASLHNTRGRLLADADRPGEAMAAYQRAVALDPALADAHHNLGHLASRLGQTEQAIAACRRAAQLAPQAARHHGALAIALRQAGELEAALTSGKRAVALEPTSAEAQNNIGNTLARLERADEAIAAYRRAIALAPRYAAAHSNLAAALANAGQADAALAAAEAALAIDPNLPEAHNHHGFALAGGGRFAEAAAAYRRAIALRPGYAEAHSNLALALLDAADDLDDAAASMAELEILAAAHQAVELEPTLGLAHTNLAQILLSLGRLAEGFAENEWRFACNPRYRRRPFSQAQWRGEPLGNCTLLIHAEQGFGDTMQFIRYAPIIAGANPGARVIVECHRELVDLFTGLPGVGQIIAAGEPLPDFDLHIPLLSVPLACGTTVATIPANVPYVHARPELVERWRTILGPRRAGGKRVGLVWAGRPTHSNDRRRSMRLADFAPLAAMEVVTYHSLQKGPAAEQAKHPPGGMRLVDHADELEDFAQTAALIAQLDVVVVVDTAVAHLAAAMGKAVILLVPRGADWRWLRRREDSPWYPTMRIVRQTRWGNWAGAVEQLTSAIKMY